MAKKKRQNIVSVMTEAIMTGASWVSVIALWCCAASVYVHPSMARIASIAGLGFPLVLCGTVFVLILCLLFAPRRSWICLFGMLCCAGSIRSYIPFNPMKGAESDSALHFINYNVHSFSYVKEDSARKEMLQYFLDEKADIICFQEGSAAFDTWRELIPEFKERLPYYSMPFSSTISTQACASRYPILRSEIVTRYEGNSTLAHWISLPSGDSLLVLNCHLCSNHLSESDRSQYSDIVHNPQKSTQQRDSTYTTSRYLASKIAKSATIRALMSDTIADYLRSHRGVPTIVCGDFNDTPISYSVYNMKRQGLNDAYRMAGNGMGRSFNKDAIAVRIDHQFCSDDLVPLRAKIDNTAPWSDHYPLVVSYKSLSPRPPR